MQGWDYGTPGYYFVTICTLNRVRWFGEIEGDHLIPTKIGEIAKYELEKTPKIRVNANLDCWVIMPNHIHVVLIILEPGEPVETPRRGVSTARNWRPGTLGVIVNQYKSMCTRRIRMLGYVDFAWQARYYDHIIRNEKSLDHIRSYINENPSKWSEDEYFSNV